MAVHSCAATIPNVLQNCVWVEENKAPNQARTPNLPGDALEPTQKLVESARVMTLSGQVPDILCARMSKLNTGKEIVARRAWRLELGASSARCRGRVDCLAIQVSRLKSATVKFCKAALAATLTCEVRALLVHSSCCPSRPDACHDRCRMVAPCLRPATEGLA